MKTKPFLFFMMMLMLSTLACNLSRPSDEQTQAALATAAVVRQQAEQVAATAAVVAATASAGGQNVLATVQATDFSMPDLSALRARVSSVLPDENGNVTFTLSEADVTNVVQDQQGTTITAEGQTITLQNPGVRFTNGLILFQGDLTQPVQTQLTASLLPIVEAGTLRFDVIDASIGSINVPPALLDMVEANLNNTLGEAMTHLPASVSLQAVTVGDGTLTITAHKD